MNEDKHLTTPEESSRMFIRYHAVLKAQGRKCACCISEIDAEKAAQDYEAARKEFEDRYRRVKEAT